MTCLIKGYQYLISPVLPAQCRFYPSCSAYALEAVRRHGALHGTQLALRRVLKCHPWHEGGFDPVPETRGKDGVRQTKREPSCQ